MFRKPLLIAAAVATAATVTLPTSASAADAVIGGLLGAGIGAAIGHNVSGHDGAIIGGVLGAVAGSAIGSNGHYDRGGYYDRGYYDTGYYDSGYYDTGYYDAGYNNRGYVGDTYTYAPVVSDYPATSYYYDYAPAPVYYAPPAVVLGSGTQLGLAVARALSELSGERSAPVEALAQRAGRGLRSAIGLHGFARGGFLVDGGRADQRDQLGTLVARYDFPSEWRLVLASPPQSSGLSGDAELRAFASQPPMSSSLTGELCRLALMDWMPAVIEADFARVSTAMYEFGLAVGQFFEPAQGGVFAHPRMARLVEQLRARGVSGIAQTSWGPTLAVLCASNVEAHQLANDYAQEGNWSDCEFRVVEPLNRAATVCVEQS